MIRFWQWFNLSHESLLSFVWMKLLRIRETVIWEELRRHKSSSLGIHKAPQDNVSRSLKHLSLGMPRKASPPSSSFISNFTWSYIFIHHMICIFLGASFYFLLFCLLLFRIMFCIFIFNKNVKDSLYHAYFDESMSSIGGYEP